VDRIAAAILLGALGVRLLMMEAPMNDRLPHEKGFHVSWDQLHRDAARWPGGWTGTAPMMAPGAPWWPSPAAAWRPR
jgi:hypothetical protein